MMKRNSFTLVVGLITSISVHLAFADDLADIQSAPYLVTSGDPADPRYANAGANLRTGVGSIFIHFEGDPDNSGFICTASLIGPRHVLTAAHCVTEADKTVDEILLVLSAGFEGYVIVPAVGFSVHPAWAFFTENLPELGAFTPGDVAVIELDGDDLPPFFERYELYTDRDEFGRETRHYGHGRSGKGNRGATGGADFFYARTGLNRYEQTIAPLLGEDFPPELFDQVLHDFDSGGSKHNAMAWWFSSTYACRDPKPNNPGTCTTFKDGQYSDFKGFGMYEVGVAPGDSGGPGFIDGRIAGIHSFGFTHLCAGIANGTDFDCALNSSYGEVAGDTRVSTYADWIYAVMDAGYEIPIGTPMPASSEGGAMAGFEKLAGKASFFLDNVEVRQLRQKVER